MTSHATFRLNWCVLIRERTLFISVTLNACSIRAGCESCLFELEPTVRVVTITAFHRSFEHFVMEGCVELWFDLSMATEAKLRLILRQQFYI